MTTTAIWREGGGKADERGKKEKILVEWTCRIENKVTLLYPSSISTWYGLTFKNWDSKSALHMLFINLLKRVYWHISVVMHSASTPLPSF